MENNGHNDQRISDLERITEALTKANRELLTAQVIMNERQGTAEQNIQRLIEAQKHTDAQIAALTAAQKGSDERVDKLVSSIGELIKRLPAVEP